MRSPPEAMVRNAVMVGERVYLRPLEVDDATALAEATTTEPEGWMERGRFPSSPLGFERYIKQVYERPPHPPAEIAFAATLVTDDRLIGSVNVDDIDWINRTGETGSFFFPGYRGQGFGTEAKHLLLEYCFEVVHLHALRSHVFAPNTRSAAALAKQGYQPAGRLRWDDLKDGVFQDTLVFDVLRADWLAARIAWQAP